MAINLGNFDFQQRRGWVRIWVLLTAVWSGYITWTTPPPWHVEQRYVLDEPLYGPEPVEEIKRTIMSAYDAKCVSGTAETVIERQIKPSRNDLDSYLDRLRRRSDPDYGPEVAQTSPVARIMVLCEPKGQFQAQWTEFLARAFVPPLAIPILGYVLWLLLTWLIGWIALGFRRSNLESEVPSNSLFRSKVQSALETPAVTRDGLADYTAAKAALYKPLSWSVFGATAIDYIGRSSMRPEGSVGTNVLLFATVALVIYQSALLAVRRGTGIQSAANLSLLTFWLLSMGIIAIAAKGS